MIKRKKLKGQATIVATAGSCNEALALYRNLVKGENAQYMTSMSGSAFIVEAGKEVHFNPETGACDLSESAEPMIAVAAASGEDIVQVEYNVCTAGCHAHVISDAPTAFCPSCSAEMPELEEDELMTLIGDDLDAVVDESDEDSVEESDDTTVLAVTAATQDEAIAKYREVLEGECIALESTSGTLITSPDADPVCEPLFGEEELTANVEMASLSSSISQNHAHVFKCAGDCGHFTVTSSDAALICINCGSGIVEPSGAHASESSSIEELEAELFSLSADDDLDEDLEDDFEDDFEDEDDLESLSGDDEDLDEDEELDDFEDEDGDDLEGLLDDGDDLDVGEDLDLEEDEDLESLSSDLDGLDLDEDEGLEEDEDEEALDLEEDEDLESLSGSKETIEINMLQAVASTEGYDASKLTVVASGVICGESTWTAFYGRTPVAMALASDVKGNENLENIFNKPAFGQAVVAAAKQDGVESALADFNFQHINPEINVQAVVEQSIMDRAEARVSEMQDSFDAQNAEMHSRLGSALATAALGINRNVFTGVSNPLANTLIQSLSASGLANAEQVVMSAFARQSDKYNEILVSQAMSLLKRPVDIQNEIATMVANAAHATVGQTQDVAAKVAAQLNATELQPEGQPVTRMQSESSAASEGNSRWLKLLSK